MGIGFISIIFGIGVGAWVFNKTSRQTGNNTKTSIIVAVFVGLMLAFVFYTLFSMILPDK